MAQDIGLRGRMDLTQFNANVQSFMRSIKGMNNEVSRVAKESTAGAATAGKAAGALGVNWQRVKDIVTGIVVIDVFRQISRGLRSIARDALDATAVFQSLQIMLEAILARDFAKTWGIPVADALGQITEKAQELLGWVREIAVTTPFSVETLASALAYGQAFGFNVEQSKRLTLATGDFVAGMGLTDLHMSRIIYNFGQMLASGRVLGRELRDLANNFVPIRDITQMLADEAGIPFEEMKKAMKEARVSAGQFIAAFVKMAEDDFAGAMERMARTIRGVQQNISDFIRTLFGLELLGPVMVRIAAIAADTLDAAFSPETIRGFAILGETLLSAFNNVFNIVSGVLVPAVKDFFKALGLGTPTVFNVASAILFLTQVLVEAIRAFRNVLVHITNFVNSLSQRFDTTLGDVVKNAAAWGGNIVIALAQGMAQAIIYIIQVLNQIARVFTFWLRGSSPPKLLPDLTKWGQQAMQSWLEGWTSADFGVFNDIASMVTRFIRSLAHEIPETGLVAKIIGARSAIQRAVNDVRKFGEVTSATLKKVVQAIHGATGAMKAFIRESFEFAKVSAIVEAAKKALDFDIELGIPVQILGQTIRNFQDLISLARKFQGVLGDALAGYARSLEAVRLATIRVAHEQKSLNDVTSKYNKQLRALRKLQDDLRKKEDDSGRLKALELALTSGLLTEEEKRRLELEKEGILLEHKINAIEQERDVAVDAARDRLDAEETILRVAEEGLERQRKLVRMIADEQLAAAREQLEMARGALQLQIEHNSLIQEQVNLLERLAKQAGGEDLAIPGMDFEGFAADVENSLLESREAIKQAIEDLKNEIFAKVRDFITTITEPFESVPDTLRTLLGNITAVFEEAGQDPAIQRFVVSLYFLGFRIEQALENIRTFWEENGPGITATIQDFFTRLGEAISPESDSLIREVADGIFYFGDKVLEVSQKLLDNGPQIQESLQGWVDWIFDEGIPKLQDFATTLKEDIIPVIKDFATIIKENAPTIIAIITALGSAFLALRPAITILSILSKVGLALIPLQILFLGLSGSVGILSGAFSGLSGIVGPVLLTIGTFIAAHLGPAILIVGVLAGVFLALKEDFLGLRTALVTGLKTIGKTLKPAIKPLEKAFKSLQPLFKSLGKFALGTLKVIGKIILIIVVPAILLLMGIVTGLIRAIITGTTSLLNAIRNIYEGFLGMWDAIKDIFVGIGQFIAGLFSGDTDKMREGLDKIMGGIGDFLENLWKTIEGIVQLLIGNAWEAITSFAEGFGEFFANLFESLGITEKAGKIIADVVLFFSDLKKKFGEGIAEAIASISEKYEAFKEAGKEFILRLIEGVREMIYGETGLIARVKRYIEGTLRKAEALYWKWKILGIRFIEKILDGLREKFEGAKGVYERFKEFILTTLETIVELKDDILQFGKDFVQGIIDGIWEKATALYNAVANVIKKALGVAEEESEVESASKKTKEIAINWMLGFQEGILAQLQSTKDTVAGAFAELMTIPESLQFDLAAVAADLSDLGNLRGEVDVQHLFEGANGGNTSLTQPAPQNTTIQNLTIEVNPTYREVQSEASIYYDVQAALAHISR